MRVDPGESGLMKKKGIRRSVYVSCQELNSYLNLGGERKPLRLYAAARDAHQNQHGGSQGSDPQQVSLPETIHSDRPFM
jgi:hypothetical protein